VQQAPRFLIATTRAHAALPSPVSRRPAPVRLSYGACGDGSYTKVRPWSRGSRRAAPSVVCADGGLLWDASGCCSPAARSRARALPSRSYPPRTSSQPRAREAVVLAPLGLTRWSKVYDLQNTEQRPAPSRLLVAFSTPATAPVPAIDRS
jgi:hypothetical protein